MHTTLPCNTSLFYYDCNASEDEFLISHNAMRNAHIAASLPSTETNCSCFTLRQKRPRPDQPCPHSKPPACVSIQQPEGPYGEMATSASRKLPVCEEQFHACMDSPPHLLRIHSVLLVASQKLAKILEMIPHSNGNENQCHANPSVLCRDRLNSGGFPSLQEHLT